MVERVLHRKSHIWLVSEDYDYTIQHYRLFTVELNFIKDVIIQNTARSPLLHTPLSSQSRLCVHPSGVALSETVFPLMKTRALKLKNISCIITRRFFY